MGALSGNSLQVIFPAVVSMIAVDDVAAAAIAFVAGFMAGFVAVWDINDIDISEIEHSMRKAIECLRM